MLYQSVSKHSAYPERSPVSKLKQPDHTCPVSIKKPTHHFSVIVGLYDLILNKITHLRNRFRTFSACWLISSRIYDLSWHRFSEENKKFQISDLSWHQYCEEISYDNDGKPEQAEDGYNEC